MVASCEVMESFIEEDFEANLVDGRIGVAPKLITLISESLTSLTLFRCHYQ